MPNRTNRSSVFAPIRAATIVLSLLALGVAEGQETNDPGELIAEPPTWILDHRSGTGIRVKDAIEAHRRRSASQDAAPQLSTFRPDGYGPKQIRRAYAFDKRNETGKGQIVAIVVAFDYPQVAADLKTFIATFELKNMHGLPGRKPCTVAGGPHPCFEVVYARGVQPTFDEGWALEGALDSQSVHALAPGADILYVEASSNAFVDLFQGVQVATDMGATVVAMSWGNLEFSAQSIFEPLLDIPGVTFVASSGDLGNGSNYPAASPRVVAAGGTTLPLDKKGRRTGPETAWSGSGGGISPFVSEPDYQTTLPIPPTEGLRGNPDVAFNSDPTTGYAIYDSAGIEGEFGWVTIGGTSAAAPGWAALFALANERRNRRGLDNLSSRDLVNRPIYDLAKGDDYFDLFFDIDAGTNGACGTVCTAAPGYDFVTGLGAPNARNLVRALGDD